MLGQSVLEFIITNEVSLDNSEDRCVWVLTHSGNFTLKSAWELIRQKESNTHLSKSCWHKNVPSKISIFVWKLIHNALPTESAIKKKEFIVSLSVCADS